MPPFSRSAAKEKIKAILSSNLHARVPYIAATLQSQHSIKINYANAAKLKKEILHEMGYVENPTITKAVIEGLKSGKTYGQIMSELAAKNIKTTRRTIIATASWHRQIDTDIPKHDQKIVGEKIKQLLQTEPELTSMPIQVIMRGQGFEPASETISKVRKRMREEGHNIKKFGVQLPAWLPRVNYAVNYTPEQRDFLRRHRSQIEESINTVCKLFGGHKKFAVGFTVFAYAKMPELLQRFAGKDMLAHLRSQIGLSLVREYYQKWFQDNIRMDMGKAKMLAELVDKTKRYGQTIRIAASQVGISEEHAQKLLELYKNAVNLGKMIPPYPQMI